MRGVASPMRPLACLMIAALSLSATPARGAEDPSSMERPTALAASAAAVAARMHTVPSAALQQGSAPAAPASGEGFLKGSRGRIAAVLFVAGVVITAVSRNRDAVHSPAR